MLGKKIWHLHVGHKTSHVTESLGFENTSQELEWYPKVHQDCFDDLSWLENLQAFRNFSPYLRTSWSLEPQETPRCKARVVWNIKPIVILLVLEQLSPKLLSIEPKLFQKNSTITRHVIWSRLEIQSNHEFALPNLTTLFTKLLSAVPP